MASFFIYSKDGDANFLAARLVREGHRVLVHVLEKNSRDVGRGIIPLTDNGTPRRGDIIIFDMVGSGKLADGFKKDGYAVIGGSRFADLLELDRSFGAKLMQSEGIPIPETYVFTSVEEAITKLEKLEGDDWFFKPHGNVGTAFTYGGKTKKDLIRFMRHAAGSVKKFELQRKVEGDEISLEGWFAGDHWVYPWNGTIEDKKFMTGNVGPNTGCMANVVWAYEEPQTTLATRTLQRLTHILTEMKYFGPLDINMIIDGKGVPYGLEFSARFGYDAFQALNLLIKGDFGAWLEEFSQSRTEKMNVIGDVLALTLNVSIPPYPNWQHAKDVKGTPLDPNILLDPLRIFPRDVMIDKRGEVAVAGGDADIMTIGDVGKDLAELRSQVLARIKTFSIPDAQYRVDPVERSERVFADLNRFGYEAPGAFGGGVRVLPPPPRELHIPTGGAPTSGNNFSEGGGHSSGSDVSNTPTGSDTAPTF